jgi:hypothetical protein
MEVILNLKIAKSNLGFLRGLGYALKIINLEEPKA